MIIENKKLNAPPVFLAHSLTKINQLQLRDIRLPQNQALFQKLVTNRSSKGQIRASDVGPILNELALPVNSIIITGHEYPGSGYGYRVFPNSAYYILHGNGPDFGYCKITNSRPQMVKVDDVNLSLRLAQDAV